VFSIATSGRTAGNGAVRYFDLTARAGGKDGRLNLRFKKERHVGQILPLSEADAAPAGPVARGGAGDKPRTRDPARTCSLGIQKYNVSVQMNERGEMVGAPPPASARSVYFRAIEYVDTFFQAEMERLMSEGKIVTRASRTRAPDAMLVGNSQVVRLYQDTVSHSATTNAGMLLVNPITRVTIKFDEATGLPRRGTEYYDFERQYPNPKDPTRFLCEELRFDGEPLCAKNVHNIRGGSEISGIANLGAMCVSNMGISVPVALDCLYLKLARPEGYSMGDIFDDDDLREGRGSVEAWGSDAPPQVGEAPIPGVLLRSLTAGPEGAEGPPAAASISADALDELAGGLNLDG
jgi:hypothetical protein